MINLRTDQYSTVTNEYVDCILPLVTERFKLREKEIQALLLRKITKNDLRDILIGKINEHSTVSFVNDYRKSIILSSINYKDGIFQFASKQKKYTNSERNYLYRITRNDLVKIYHNDLISHLYSLDDLNIISFKDFKILQAEIKKIIEPFDILFKDIFNYNSFLGKNKKLRAKIIDATNVTVCPYCNRQFIDKYKDRNKQESVLAQLDHFYPQSKFPLFSLSLYNFVPSCAHCNSILKRDKVIDVMYPFNNNGNSEDFFNISYKNYRQVIGIELPEIEIIKNNNFSCTNELLHCYALEIMRTKELYKNHRNFVMETNWKSSLDSVPYRQFLKNTFKAYNSKNLTDEEISLIIYSYSGTEEELYKRPLSKLAHELIPVTQRSY
jgi:hypothetical protein